jgi:hypothetical protein
MLGVNLHVSPGSNHASAKLVIEITILLGSRHSVQVGKERNLISLCRHDYKRLWAIWNLSDIKVCLWDCRENSSKTKTNTTRMGVAITLWMSITKCETIPFIINSSNKLPWLPHWLHQLSMWGVFKSVNLPQALKHKFTAPAFPHQKIRTNWPHAAENTSQVVPSIAYWRISSSTWTHFEIHPQSTQAVPTIACYKKLRQEGTQTFWWVQ